MSRILAAIALPCALYLSGLLTVQGVDKFHYLLAGGKKFSTFAGAYDQIGIGLSYLVLMGLYLVWFLATPSPQNVKRFRQFGTVAGVFLLLAFLAYPLGNDVYLYLNAGLMNWAGVNPYLVPAKQFVSPLSPFIDWGQTSTYGPLSQLLFTAAAAAVPIHPILGVYIFKGFCLGLHILNGYLIWRLLPDSDRSRITLAYLINPLLLMEQVGSAHVDILVSTSAILLIGSLTSRRYVSGFMALWGGILAKTLPIIWMPLVAVFLLRQQRWRAIATIILLSSLLITGLGLTLLPTLPAWRSLVNPGVAGQYQSSLHSLASSLLEITRVQESGLLTLGQSQQVMRWFTQATQLGFCGFYAWLAWKGYRRRYYTERSLIEDLGWATLVLLLFATPWVMPWYASVLLTIAALIPQARLFGLSTLVFGLSSSAQYLLQGQSLFKSLLAVGLPTLVLLVGAVLYKPRRVEETAVPSTVRV